jgi:hypothetical protein
VKIGLELADPFPSVPGGSLAVEILTVAKIGLEPTDPFRGTPTALPWPELPP